ncbi:MAG: TetR/AcrR family transcriptional regulator [Acidimicrobiia bacterium]|nr:TetR/AcrR family transcriptional regulator [Acidimicrobiia bacterium]
MSTQSQGAETRATLLDAAVEFAANNGLSDVSLRQMATALGTSHRMLIYHFGSKEGLLVGVVNEVERRQREGMLALGADDTVSPADALRQMWATLADSSLWPFERLFFEVYGQALQGRPHMGTFLDGVVDSWLEPATALGMRMGMRKRDARAWARLGLAVTRGILLDLLATGDRKGCDDAIDKFVASLPPELSGEGGGAATG